HAVGVHPGLVVEVLHAEDADLQEVLGADAVIGGAFVGAGGGGGVGRREVAGVGAFGPAGAGREPQGEQQDSNNVQPGTHWEHSGGPRPGWTGRTVFSGGVVYPLSCVNPVSNRSQAVNATPARQSGTPAMADVIVGAPLRREAA